MAPDLPDKDAADRRAAVAVMERDIAGLSREVREGFNRLERKVDSNLEALSNRIESQEHGLHREVQALGVQVKALETWRAEAMATMVTQEKLNVKGVQTKHLWLASIGLFVAMGGLLVTAVGVVLTVMLTS